MCIIDVFINLLLCFAGSSSTDEDTRGDTMSTSGQLMMKHITGM